MKVFVANKIPEIGINILKEKGYDVEVFDEDRVLSKEELMDKIKDKDALISLLTNPIDKEVLSSNPDLKVVSNYAVGFNNIDIDSATELKLPVCNTPGVLTDTTADLAFTLIMATARRIVESDNFMRSGQYKRWGPMLLLGKDVFKKSLGIVGSGRIGFAVAKRAKGFDMNILYTDVKPNEEFEKEFDAKFLEKDELLKTADIITLHVPLTPQTRHLINAEALEMMKDSAIVINTSRGEVIDEAALVTALKEKKIFAAGLDVYENEPKMADGLTELDNAIILPHIGSASEETRDKMSEMAAKNLIAVCEGEKPLSCINESVLGGSE